MNTTSDDVAAPSPGSRNSRTRRRALVGVTAVVAVGLIAYGIYYGVHASHFVSTDDAYVEGNVVQITPQVGGTVVAINADDTDLVHAGAPLVQFDRADGVIALDQAEARLAQTVRQVRTLYASNRSFAAQVALKNAEIDKARSDVDRARDDLERRKRLASTGAVSTEELHHAESEFASVAGTLAAARSGAVAAREELLTNQALTDGTTVQAHPQVAAAAVEVRRAYLELQRTLLPAPVTGYVAQRNVQVGQHVPAAMPLMSIVPLDSVWVEANFKEVQVRDMRIGQPVTLTADVYGRKVEYRGSVAGLGIGTGAAFALLPTQNASGNWIKIVQRIPVRIELVAGEVREHPLRIGLSMAVEVDVRDQQGLSLAAAPRARAVASTRVFENAPAEADALVARIIGENLARTEQPQPDARSGGKAAARTARQSQPRVAVATRSVE
jgi:membrane fusion protein (multidrug efflux system)